MVVKCFFATVTSTDITFSDLEITCISLSVQVSISWPQTSPYSAKKAQATLQGG